MRNLPRRFASLLVGTLAAGGNWSCREASVAPSPDPTAVIATYQGGEIRQSDVDAWKAHRPDQTDERAEARWRMDLVEVIALHRSLAGEAEERGLDREPSVVHQLSAQEDRVLTDALQRAMRAEVVVGGEEVEALLERYAADRNKPERRRLSWILERVPRDAAPAARQAARRELAEIRERILAGEDFAAVARETSDSPTRFRGGNLGMLARDQLPPALGSAVFALPAGGLSEILEADQGYALFRCDEIVPARVMPEEEARQRIEEHLRGQQAQRAWSELQTRLAAEVRHDLAGLQDPATPAAAVVSRFGDGRLTREQVNWVLAATLRESEPRSLPVGRVVSLLDAHAFRHLAASEARRRGLDRDYDVAGALRATRWRLLARLELRRRLEEGLEETSDAEARALFDAEPERFRAEERFRLAVLWQPADEATRVENFRLLEATVADVRAGELTFAEAAKAASAHPAKPEGGELGWRSRREVAAWGPTALRMVESLAVGEVSDVVAESDAMWVFHLLDRQESEPLAWEEAREEALELLGRRRREAAQATTLRQLLADLDVRPVGRRGT